MKTDFRAFFLLVETITEIRPNSVFKNIPARGSLFKIGETDIPASGKHFFSRFFRDSCQFFPSSRKVFFNEILHSGSWKRIFWLVETVSVCSEFSLWKKSLKLMKVNFYWKPSLKLMKVNF